MTRLQTMTALALALALAPAAAWAGPCDGLKGAHKTQAAALYRATFPYDCCDETLDRCLKQKRVCRLALRLRDDICRRVALGQGAEVIKKALQQRARSMTPVARKAAMDLSLAPVAGDAGAPVQVVVYACARCPFCARVVPELHRLATAGATKGKVRLQFRPFPIRGHAGSVEGGLAFVAAARLGRFWPFAELLFKRFEKFSTDKLGPWAAEAGLDAAAFGRELAAKETRALLVKSKKEGLRNGVNATPTLFINGRRYQGDLSTAALTDVFLEEADRVQGRVYGP